MILSTRSRGVILGCRMFLLAATMGLSLPCMRAILGRGGSAWWMALLAAAHLAGLAVAQRVIKRAVVREGCEYPLATSGPGLAQPGQARQQKAWQAASGAFGATALAILLCSPPLRRAGAAWVGRAVWWIADWAHASNFSVAVMLLALCGLLFGWRAGRREIREIESSRSRVARGHRPA